MQNCQISITTVVDGNETQFSTKGRMESLPLGARLTYTEKNAVVGLEINGNQAKIVRTGDYTLALTLKHGESANGSIGIGGSSGEISTYTHKLAYSAQETSLLVSLVYDLTIGGEKQEMRLRIYAKAI